MADNSPKLTNLLILSMVLVQVYLSNLPEGLIHRIIEDYAIIPKLVGEGNLVSLLTYMFIHGGWNHLIVNLFALWGVGYTVEREINSTAFGLAFLSTGVLSGYIYSQLHQGSIVPLVGASGAIFGLIAIIFLLMPFEPSFALLIPLPSVIVGIVLIGAEVFALLYSPEVGVAHEVHVLGFITGCVAAFVIDTNRAIKGLIIASITLVAIYLIGAYYGLL